MKHKQILSFLIVFAMLVGMFGGTGAFAVSAAEAGGTDTEIPDYIQTTMIDGVEYLLFDSGEDMAWLRAHVMNMEDGADVDGKYYCTHNIMLTADIDMADYNATNGVNNGSWSGIGWGQSWIGYSGIFDGNGHTIYNIEVYTDQAVGPKGLLFNITKDSTIKNIVVQGTVTGNRFIGGLVGRTTGSITLENVVVDADLLLSNGNANAVGGLIGQVGSGQTTGGDTISITNCAAVGTYTSETNTNPVGGLIGYIYGGYTVRISNSYSAADLSCEGGTTAGLIAGQGTKDLQISNSYYLDTMGPSLVIMTANGDPSPVGPNSSMVKATAETKDYIKSSQFLDDLGGAFASDGHPPLAQGYPVPVTITPNNCTFSEFIWSEAPVTEYSVGASFDFGSLKVIARYMDASNQPVDVDVTKYVTANKDILTAADNDSTVTLSVAYDGYSASTGIATATKEYTLKVRNLTALTVTTPPKTTIYYEGQAFSTAGMVVTGNFEETGDEVITAYSYSPSGPLTMEDTVVAISYLDKTVEIPIQVLERNVVKFEVTKPSNLIYASDEAFDPEGMVVKVYYDYAPGVGVVLEAAKSGEDASGKYTYSLDGNTVTVSYEEKGVIYTEEFSFSVLDSAAPELVDGVYQLSTPDHLVWFANQVNALGNGAIDGVLLNDIDLSDAELFLPIGLGLMGAPYGGSFDGNGHTVILNLHTEDVAGFSASATCVGLFGYVYSAENDGAVIKNLTVDGEIAVSNAYFVGGIAGNVAQATIENCINRANITNTTESYIYTGGIIGSISGKNSIVNVLNCTNEGNITSTWSNGVAGGIVGYTSYWLTATISNCENLGNIAGGAGAGGISAYSSGTVENCFNRGVISSETGYAGGIAGTSVTFLVEAKIVSSYNTGKVEGTTYAGGIVGYTQGMLGVARRIENAYNVGSVAGTDGSSAIVGAILGNANAKAATLTNAYYLAEGETTIVAYNEQTEGFVTAENVAAKPSDELKDAAILELLGDGFTLAHSEMINDGYPVLTWQLETLPDDAHEWDEGVVTKEPTYTEEGEITYTCLTCGETKVEILEMLIPTVTAAESENGSISVPENAQPGSTVTITVTPDKGYELDKLTVQDESGADIAVTKVNGAYTFTMPAAPVTVTATFAKIVYSVGDVAPTENAVTAAECENGTVAVSPEKAKQGDTVTITVTPDEGWELDKLTVLDADGKEIAVTETNGVYTFTMPAGAVSVTAAFKAVEQTSAKEMVFTDVSTGDWFYDDVKYVFETDLMNGTGETLFSPSLAVSRAMIVTILYRLEGEPAVTGGNAFTDVPADEWYTDAVIWAAQNSIVLGYGDGAFGPTDNITREQMAAILYRYAQFKEYDTTASADLGAFTDADQISAYALPAMRWANAEGLINGVGGGLIDAQGSAVRSQAAAILARFCRNIAEI